MDSITIPKELNEGHIGFTLDAGGSVVKVLYRPKKPESRDDNTVVLAVKMIKINNIDSLFDFIEENCDITVPEGNSPEAYFTGVRIHNIEKRLMEKYGVKVTTVSEFDACVNGILYMTKHLPMTTLYHPVKQSTIDIVLQRLEHFIKTYIKEPRFNAKMKEMAEQAETPMKMHSQMSQEEIAGLTMMVNNAKISWPIYAVTAGSAFASYVVQENGDYQMTDFSSGCGKMLLGLGYLILGTRDFDEILDLASRGDSSKVHTLGKDLKRKSSLDQRDVYAKIPEFLTLFSFGKAHDSKYDGTYSREDLAAALVSHIVMDIAHTVQLNLLCRNINTALIVGSFFQHELIRDMFYENCHQRAVSEPKLQKSVVKIMRQSGFVTSFGCWMWHYKQSVYQ